MVNIPVQPDLTDWTDDAAWAGTRAPLRRATGLDPAAYVDERFFALGPTFQAPAVNPSPEGAPDILPFVFIVIACGAASGAGLRPPLSCPRTPRGPSTRAAAGCAGW